mmetsp:Transcript_28127/g.66814  ORF Transcript_28127/g.66814 Transcript_28127/m.66814 type:complete len:238 (+) Transcript_28127:858-1571(+)
MRGDGEGEDHTGCSGQHRGGGRLHPSDARPGCGAMDFSCHQAALLRAGHARSPYAERVRRPSESSGFQPGSACLLRGSHGGHLPGLLLCGLRLDHGASPLRLAVCRDVYRSGLVFQNERLRDKLLGPFHSLRHALGFHLWPWLPSGLAPLWILPVHTLPCGPNLRFLADACLPKFWQPCCRMRGQMLCLLSVLRREAHAICHQHGILRHCHELHHILRGCRACSADRKRECQPVGGS